MDMAVYMTSTMTSAEKIEAAKHIYPDYATIFACVCASLFAVVGVIGESSGCFLLLRHT